MRPEHLIGATTETKHHLPQMIMVVSRLNLGHRSVTLKEGPSTASTAEESGKATTLVRGRQDVVMSGRWESPARKLTGVESSPEKDVKVRAAVGQVEMAGRGARRSRKENDPGEVLAGDFAGVMREGLELFWKMEVASCEQEMVVAWLGTHRRREEYAGAVLSPALPFSPPVSRSNTHKACS
ncbi:hypothetical protein E3N88_32767 [Mikania micrantha]|uniref:Uncharacterized protein n=1 Tax=Mikania micrantha TaxID=192012 RepID=A0A5N6M9W3_9ASTR|nr:hypothetical protein E3N88_32767 [Mikania micrantha]